MIPFLKITPEAAKRMWEMGKWSPLTYRASKMFGRWRFVVDDPEAFKCINTGPIPSAMGKTTDSGK